MKRSTKIRVPLAKVVELAERFDEDYADRIADGFTFSASSGFWQTKRGCITARFVYRKGGSHDDGGRVTHTTIITGIRP